MTYRRADGPALPDEDANRTAVARDKKSPGDGPGSR